METYRELRERQQEEFNEFPLMFAFNQKQFDEGMRKLGLKPSDTDKIYSIGGGGYYRKSDAKAFHELIERSDKELRDAIAADETGEGFIYDMFMYELANHEYCITYDVEPALDAIGLTYEEVQKDPRMKEALSRACQKQAEIDW